MKEIYKTENFKERTELEQQIIDLVTDNFPETGYPTKVITDEKYIIIASHLCLDGIGYRHKDFNKKSDCITIYNKSTLQLLATVPTKYPCYNAVVFEDVIYMATGIFGDGLNGMLLGYDALHNKTFQCSDNSRPVMWLKMKENLMEVYTFKSTGYYESEPQLFHVINPFTSLFFKWEKEEYVPFDENELDIIVNNDSDIKRFERLKNLIALPRQEILEKDKKIKFVYLLWHTHKSKELRNGDDAKLLGTFSSAAKAEIAKYAAMKLNGFKDHVEDFEISEYEIDKQQWKEGFGTV